MKDSKLSEVIQQTNTGKKYPAISLVKDNPELAAVISKLVKSRDTGKFDMDKEKTSNYLNQGQLEKISSGIQQNIVDSESIVQLFPDIELSIQILISSVLSPKDMTNSDLIYKTPYSNMGNELSTKLNQVIRSHMSEYYKLDGELPKMLRDSLFTKGSYIKMVMPESIVDEVVNFNSVSTESLSELFKKDFDGSLGILGNYKKAVSNQFSLESLALSNDIGKYVGGLVVEDNERLENCIGNLVDITDNYKILKVPKVMEKVRASKIKKIIKSNSVAVESNTITNKEVSSALYKGASKKAEQFVIIPEPTLAKRKSVARPLVMKLPSESVIPVYTPGDEANHIGYFIIIDNEGNPVTIDGNGGHSSDLQSLLSNSKSNNNDSVSSMLIDKAKNNLIGSGRAPTLDQITTVYGNIIERNLVTRLRNGIYNSTLKISNSQEIYRVMLTRVLSEQYTRLVYVPVELVGYLAFKYNNNGTGRSYLDDVKVLTSLRAMLLFSKVMAMTKNAINLTRVNMTLDPKDPDPEKTMELAIHEIAKTRQQYFPLGINSPVDLVDWIQKAGFEFTFEGHPGLPDTKFDFETKNIQRDIPDSDLDELLRKQTYMAFGLSPEVVDDAFSGDFATTVVANNLLLAKRIRHLQTVFSTYIADLNKKITFADPILMGELTDLIRSNKDAIETNMSDGDRPIYDNNPDEYIATILEEHIESLEIDLPQPDTVTLENLSEAFDNYVDNLEKAIDAIISTDSITSELAGDVSNNIDTIKSIVKNYYIRRWMSNNGYLPELSEITTVDEDGKPSIDLFEISKDHVESIIKATIKLVSKVDPLKKAADKDLENLDKTIDDDADSEVDNNDNDFDTSSEIEL